MGSFSSREITDKINVAIIQAFTLLAFVLCRVQIDP